MATDTLHDLSPDSQQTLVMPASRAQCLIWTRVQESENPAAWNVAVRFTLRGELRTSVFRAAVARVVASNEILRTTLLDLQGVLSQVIHPHVVVPVSVLDLSLLAPEEQQETLFQRSAAEARRPFALATAPLLRIRLVCLGSREHVLLITVHHAISDGWSIGLISDALMQAYSDQLNGTPQSSEPMLQYADYSVWQAERNLTPEYRQHEAFWAKYLIGLAPASASTSSDAADSEAAIVSVVLPNSLTERVAALARQRGATFSQVVASAFGVLRSWQTQQSTVVFGSPVAGRDSAELESVIGPFVNYLPVRVECAPATTVAELISSTAAMFAEWIEHSEYRSVDILNSLNRQNDPFDALFINQRDFVHTVERAGLTLTALPSVSPGALYGMTFFLVERKDGWRASCEVDTAKYSVEVAEGLLKKYQQILEAFAQRPEQTIGELTGQVEQILPGRPVLLAPKIVACEAEPHPIASFVDFPASETQARYFLLDRSDVGKSTFHLRIRMTVDGDLQINRVTQAFDILIRRHEILRTTFVMAGEQLHQRVHEPTLAPSFQYLDASSLTAVERDDAIRRALLREDDWHFDLGSGPLVRAFVAELCEGKWILAITLAHILADGWSAGILQNEFQKTYAALLREQHPDLADLPVQYGDVAVAEEKWLHSANVRTRAEFWRDRLSGKLAALDLPVDIRSEQTSKTNGAVEFRALDASLAASVRQLARDLETTPFVVYGAIFQALLFRYSQETDITFSTPLANRTDETENVMGPFSTPVLLRTQIQSGWSIRQLIQALHRVALDAFDNPLPFERYADSVALSTVRGRHALNQLGFFYQKAFVQQSEMEGIRFTPLPTSVTGAGFEWQLAIIERHNEPITAELQYDADQYSSATVQTALSHYERFLSEALFHLDAPLAGISFATSEEFSASPDQLLPISRRALGIETGRKLGAVIEAPAPADDVLPRTNAEHAMAQLWQQAFRRETPISVTANFFDLGGHSLTFARLQVLCQNALGKRIYAADLFSAPTIAALTAKLSAPAPDAVPSNPRLIPLRATGTQSPLFLISQSMIFRRVAECLGPDQPVFTVQIEDDDLTGKESFEDFARYYVHIIRKARPHGPYRIGGWCAAAWVAYEIAQQLRAAGETVEMLLLVDAWAPGHWRDQSFGRRVVAKANYYWARFNLHRRTVAALSREQQRAFFKERVRLWKASITRQMGAFTMLRRLPKDAAAGNETTLVDQVQYAAGIRYRARPWPGSALLFRSSEQPSGRFLPHDLGWSKLLTDNPSIIKLPGDHRRIFDDPGAQIIADSVKSFLPGKSSGAQSPADKKPSVSADSEIENKVCAVMRF